MFCILLITMLLLSLSKALRTSACKAIKPRLHNFSAGQLYSTARASTTGIGKHISSARDAQDVLDTIFNMGPSVASALMMGPTIYGPTHMQMDIKESENSYEIQVDIPGVRKKDIQVEIKDEMLTVCASRESTKKEEGETFRRVERYSGSATRSITLPRDADEESIVARTENGVLYLKIEKRDLPEKEKPKVIDVK